MPSVTLAGKSHSFNSPLGHWRGGRGHAWLRLGPHLTASAHASPSLYFAQPPSASSEKAARAGKTLQVRHSGLHMAHMGSASATRALWVPPFKIRATWRGGCPKSPKAHWGWSQMILVDCEPGYVISSPLCLTFFMCQSPGLLHELDELCLQKSNVSILVITSCNHSIPWSFGVPNSATPV